VILTSPQCEITPFHQLPLRRSKGSSSSRANHDRQARGTRDYVRFNSAGRSNRVELMSASNRMVARTICLASTTHQHTLRDRNRLLAGNYAEETMPAHAREKNFSPEPKNLAKTSVGDPRRQPCREF
jgi:hypothetical protein